MTHEGDSTARKAFVRYKVTIIYAAVAGTLSLALQIIDWIH